jgi:hypothetical protein
LPFCRKCISSSVVQILFDAIAPKNTLSADRLRQVAHCARQGIYMLRNQNRKTIGNTKEDLTLLIAIQRGEFNINLKNKVLTRMHQNNLHSIT